MDDRRRARSCSGRTSHLQAPPNLTTDFAAPARRGHRRLGRRLAGHDRPRQSRGAVARARAAARGDREPRARARAAADRLSRTWISRRVARSARAAARAARRRTRSGSRARTAGRPARPAAFRSSSARRAADRHARASSARKRSCGSSARAGRSATASFAAADRLRREVNGDDVTYVVTRNIQYTNVCYFRCGFCAFSKGKLAANLRGAPYLVPHDEIVRRCEEAWERGATEVCLQGGIHPAFDGRLLPLGRSRDQGGRAGAARARVLGARGLAGRGDARRAARRLSRAAPRRGARSLPGTAAEILDDEVRRVICPDKITTAQWLEVHDAAHRVGLRSNNTIMFGHVEGPRNWARHLRARARAAADERRLHGVRAAAVRAHGGADVPARAGALGADVRRDAAHARGRAARAASVDHEHPGLVGEGRRRRRRGPRFAPASTTSAARS